MRVKTLSAASAAILGFALAGAAFTATAEIPKPVTVENTPTVNVGNMPTVNVGNSPTVNIGNTPSVTVGNLPDVQDVIVRPTPGGYSLRIIGPVETAVPFDSLMVGVLLTTRQPVECEVRFLYDFFLALPNGQGSPSIALATLNGSDAVYVPLPDMFIASGESIAVEGTPAECGADATVYLRPASP